MAPLNGVQGHMRARYYRLYLGLFYACGFPVGFSSVGAGLVERALNSRPEGDLQFV